MLRPRGVSLHYEVELALVMGRGVRDMGEGDEEAAVRAVDGGFPPGSSFFPPFLNNIFGDWGCGESMINGGKG